MGISCVVSLSCRDRRSEDTGTRADVEDALAGSRRQEVEYRRNGYLPVVLATVLADPPQIPIGHVLPAGFRLIALVADCPRVLSHRFLQTSFEN